MSIKNLIIYLAFAIAVPVGSQILGFHLAESPEDGMTLLVAVVPVVICVWLILRDKANRQFLLRIFALALALRWGLAYLIYSRNLQTLFGSDAETYDSVGAVLARAWMGLGDLHSPYMALYMDKTRPGWGMFYYIGSLYYLIGQNALAAQLINCALGAAACVAVYKVARMIHPSPRVARSASILIALSPSMILWSSQLLKDGPIVLALSLCTLYALKLRERFSVKSLLLLVVFLFCLYTLRYYAFYIMFLAIVGSLLVAAKKFTPLRVLQGGLLVVVLGVALTYLGAANVPQQSLDLKHIQIGRQWSAKVSNTGFGGDVDITDPKAAIGFLPLGLLYVLFAPFPWAINNLKQLITLPELIIWWALVPMLVRGYWYAVRRRLKETFTMCVFTAGLPVVYALFQTNAGTAYRHRAQLYVFFVIFISIGMELRREARLKKRARVEFGDPAFATIVPAPFAGSQVSPRIPQAARLR
jgi:hypothetical protein